MFESYKKYWWGILLVIISVFLAVKVEAATFNPDVENFGANCGSKIPGKRHAIFVVNTNGDAYDSKSGNPTEEEITESQSAASFIDFYKYPEISKEGETQIVDSATCLKIAQNECGSVYKGCFWWPNENKCVSWNDEKICSKLPQALCGIQPDGSKPGSLVCKWNDEQKQCFTFLEAGIAEEYKKPEGWLDAMPPCAFSGTCKDVNDLVQLIVNVAKGFFMVIGTFAFAFFIYGGYTIIVSFGNAEMVQKGKKILASAAVGLIIVFIAYIAINFLLTTVGVAPEFRAIK